jgi:hypothetical protein
MSEYANQTHAVRTEVRADAQGFHASAFLRAIEHAPGPHETLHDAGLWPTQAEAEAAAEDKARELLRQFAF